MKVCSRCKEAKDESAYFKKSGHPGQYLSMCKVCRKAYAAQVWKDKMADPEKRELAMERNRQNAANHRASGYSKKWFDENRDHINALRRARYKRTGK